MRVQFYIIIICAMAISNLMSSCNMNDQHDLTNENIIPKPSIIKATGSKFTLSEKTKIIVGNNSEELKMIGEYFANLLKPATGFKFDIEHKTTASSGNFFLYVSNNNPDLGEEGYELTITNSGVKLEANKPAGIFRGIQTIRQLFPIDIEKQTVQYVSWELSSGIIIDYPNYEYRGAMLDVCRHFYDVDEVKQYIDWLARYKMNVLHLHLTDDQGWRIEIKKWPDLTKIGGSTEVGGGSGGYFTQEQYTELVDYASQRYITIVPEIDMPGHTNAALASYAELNCDKKATELYTGTEVGFSSLCIQNEIIYEFIEDVISEMASLTPGPYIHIGGDESHSTKKSDYIDFIDKVQGIVSSHGKQMIGWDEITLTKLNPGTIAQFWDSEENAREAVNQGIKVIMSPASKAYLDMKYDSTTVLGLNWAGYIEVNTGYNWVPENLLPGLEKEHILGVECPLWTETLTDMKEIEYLVFPRLLGYAEIGWSQTENRNWEDYKLRLSNHSPRFKEMGINYYASELINWQ